MFMWPRHASLVIVPTLFHGHSKGERLCAVVAKKRRAVNCVLDWRTLPKSTALPMTGWAFVADMSHWTQSNRFTNFFGFPPLPFSLYLSLHSLLLAPSCCRSRASSESLMTIRASSESLMTIGVYNEETGVTGGAILLDCLRVASAAV